MRPSWARKRVTARITANERSEGPAPVRVREWASRSDCRAPEGLSEAGDLCRGRPVRIKRSAASATAGSSAGRRGRPAKCLPASGHGSALVRRIRLRARANASYGGSIAN